MREEIKRHFNAPFFLTLEKNQFGKLEVLLSTEQYDETHARHEYGQTTALGCLYNAEFADYDAVYHLAQCYIDRNAELIIRDLKRSGTPDFNAIRKFIFDRTNDAFLIFQTGGGPLKLRDSGPKWGVDARK